MASAEETALAVCAAQEASAVEYLRRTGHREADVLTRVLAERDQLRLLAGPVPASDALLHKLKKLSEDTTTDLPWAQYIMPSTEETVFYRSRKEEGKNPDEMAWFSRNYDGDYALAICNAGPSLLARVRVAEGEANQAKGELRGAFLALSHLTPEHITPEWRARMKAIYLEKGGEVV